MVPRAQLQSMEEILYGFLHPPQIVLGQPLIEVYIRIVILNLRYLLEIPQSLLRPINLQIHLSSRLVNTFVIALTLKNQSE